MLSCKKKKIKKNTTKFSSISLLFEIRTHTQTHSKHLTKINEVKQEKFKLTVHNMIVSKKIVLLLSEYCP